MHRPGRESALLLANVAAEKYSEYAGKQLHCNDAWGDFVSVIDVSCSKCMRVHSAVMVLRSSGGLDQPGMPVHSATLLESTTIR